MSIFGSRPAVANGRSNFAVGLCLILAATGPLAHAAVANVAADAHVTSTLPNTNFGSRSNLAINSTSAAYLRFDLSSLPSGTTSAQVAKATVYVYVNRMNASGKLNLAPLNAGFSEFSVTYSSRPPANGDVSQATVMAAASFIALDATQLVQGWLTAPSSNYGVSLTGTADVLLDSKENDLTGHAAYLDIALVNQGPQGLQGPPGLQGPQGDAGSQGPAGPQGPAGASAAIAPNSVSLYYYGMDVSFAGRSNVTYTNLDQQIGTGLTPNMNTGTITVNVTGTYLVSYTAYAINTCSLLIFGGIYSPSSYQGAIGSGEISWTGVLQLTAGNLEAVTVGEDSCTLAPGAGGNNASFSITQLM